MYSEKCITVFYSIFILCVCKGSLHTGYVCSECRQNDFVGVRWSCLICTDVHLCRYCYGNDKHDISHRFFRFDWPSSDGHVKYIAFVTLADKLTVV